jgi:hypothetical protein
MGGGVLIVAAYAHVILEIAVAVLAIVVAARVMMSPAPGLLAAHLARQVRRWQAIRRLAQRRAALDAPAWRDREAEEVKE